MTKILITGASGYIGGRLLHHLNIDNYQITCMARNPLLLENRFSHKIKIVKGDTLDIESLEKVLHNIDVAFYLVHSMGSKGNFEEEERVELETVVEDTDLEALEEKFENFLKGCGHDNVSVTLSLYGDDSMSNSTFSWWGSWLGKSKEKIVAPKKWFGIEGPPNYDDLYRNEMIII